MINYIPVLHPAGILRGQFEKRPLLIADIAAGLNARFVPPVCQSLTASAPFGLALAIDVENRPDGSVDLLGMTVDGDTVYQVPGDQLWRAQPYLDAAHEIIAHNAAHDYRCLIEAGLRVSPSKLRDSMIAQAMLLSDLEVGLGNALAITLPGRWVYHKQLWGRHWKPAQIEACRAIWRRIIKTTGWDEPSWYRFYNCLDTAGTWRLWQEQKRQLDNRLRYFVEVMMPCAIELWQLEACGLRVSHRARRKHRVRLARREKELHTEITAMQPVWTALAHRVDLAQEELRSAEDARDMELEELNREALAIRATMKRSAKGKPRLVRKSKYTPMVAKARAKLEVAALFNPGSSQQKAWLLYEVLKLPVQRHAKTKQVTTDKRALGRLGRLKSVNTEAKAIVAALVEYEHVNQLRTTFVDVNVSAGRLYTSYGLHRTGTGRIASGTDADEKAAGADTNAQNWPKELRDIVVPEDGCAFVGGDWSQVEWLLSLWFAEDQANFSRACAGDDSHRRVASVLFGVQYDSVQPEQRQLAKKVNHASNYGMGVGKLADEVGITMAEAKAAMAAIKAAYPLVATWRERVCEEGYRQHYLQTPFGWRRWFFNPSPDVPKMLAFLPSATGADMLKVRLPLVAGMAREHAGRLLTTTHDSFLIEAPAERAETAAFALKQIMEHPFSTLGGVSFPAEVKIGRDWREVS